MESVINLQNIIDNIKLETWSGIRQAVTNFTKMVLEQALNLEKIEQLGCLLYERSLNRKDYSNGSYLRTISTTYGFINNLKVPRLRKTKFVSRLLQRYKRRTDELDQALLMWYIQGESSRDVARSINSWACDVLTSQSVSRLIKSIDQYLVLWRQRDISSEFTAVWLDGFSVKVRVKRKVRNYVILTALGLHTDGRWEVLSFRLAESESEQRWRELLYQMKKRGMRTMIFIHDGAGGIEQALRWDYPNVASQRCLVHKLRNILAVASEKNKQQVKQDFWAIYNSATIEDAKKRFYSFCRKWASKEPEVVFVVRSHYQYTFTFFYLPDNIKILCRTTNMIESLHHELRRRVKVIGSFPNPKSCERIIFLTLLYIEHVNLNKTGNMLSFFKKFTQN